MALLRMFILATAILLLNFWGSNPPVYSSITIGTSNGRRLGSKFTTARRTPKRRATKRRATKRRATKRRATKRRATKRRATKRRATKRRNTKRSLAKRRTAKTTKRRTAKRTTKRRTKRTTKRTTKRRTTKRRTNTQQRCKGKKCKTKRPTPCKGKKCKTKRPTKCKGKQCKTKLPTKCKGKKCKTKAPTKCKGKKCSTVPSIFGLGTPRSTPTSKKTGPIDFQASVNEKAHHTNFFRNRAAVPSISKVAMILRRAASFTVKLEADENIKCRAVFRHSRSPASDWKVTVDEGTVTIAIPSNAAIGYHDVTLGTQKFSLIVLLNPWSSSDSVYMPNTAELDEYVLHEKGVIYQGSWKDYKGHFWNYDQFDATSLHAALTLLNSPEMDSLAAYSDPVLLSRFLAWQGGNSVCYGSWEAPYTTGCGGYCCGDTPTTKCWEPWKLNSALNIFKQFLAGKKNVQYCQCFVFAGITTSASRALGLPSRPVTNFQSGADHNNNGAIDQYYEIKDGFYKRVSVNDGDSVWNFHVWNEAWMKRAPQEGLELSGWQAYDATPQVQSGGRYQIGPAPVMAVFHNRKNINYDVQFLDAEVNGNINIWVKQANGEFKLTKTSLTDPFDTTRTVGQKISTKKPGPISDTCKRSMAGCEPDRLDVTALYKRPEPSGTDPWKYRKRNIDVEGADDQEDSDNDDRQFSPFQDSDNQDEENSALRANVIFPPDDVRVERGDEVSFGYEFANEGDEPLTLFVYYEVDAVDYRDEVLLKIAEMKRQVVIHPLSKMSLVKAVKDEDYEEAFKTALDGDVFLDFILSVRVDSTNQTVYHQKSLQVHDIMVPQEENVDDWEEKHSDEAK